MKRAVLGAALAMLLAMPAHASVIYDFVTTNAGGTHPTFAGFPIQLVLTDEAAGQSSISFSQHGGAPGMGIPHVYTGSGVEQFSFNGQARVPIVQFSANLDIELVALLGGGLGGDIDYGKDTETLDITYDAATGLWHGAFSSDQLNCTGASGGNSCLFTGTFVRAVPEPAGLALLALPLLLAWRLRPTA